MKYRNLIIKIIIVASIIVTFIIYNKSNYIVKINKEKISRQEYLIYLREQEINFEKLSGTKDIWNTTINGIDTEELAKKNALDSIVFVKTMKKQAKNLNIKLSKEDKKDMEKMINKIYNELDENEKKEIKKNIIRKVVEEGILQEKVKYYITKKSSYLESFEDIYEKLLESITIEKNAKVWDKIKRM